jgi:pyridoxine/pyridoxamine 5'-phosphate oxidase
VNRSDRNKLLTFMRQELYAVQASVSALGAPQAAIVGVVVSDKFEVFFDTLASSRKTINLRRNSAAALVIGPAALGSERTVQLEGTADEPTGAELERLLELYFARFPSGRERQKWAGITYWRVSPTWLRYSDFSVDPPEIVEFKASDLV